MFALEDIALELRDDCSIAFAGASDRHKRNVFGFGVISQMLGHIKKNLRLSVLVPGLYILLSASLIARIAIPEQPALYECECVAVLRRQLDPASGYVDS